MSVRRGRLVAWPPRPPVAEPAQSAVARSPSSRGGTRATIPPVRGGAVSWCPVRARVGRRNSVRRSRPWTGTSSPTSPDSCPSSSGPQFPATDFTATDTGAEPLISSRVRPFVAGVSTSSARTAATSSRGTGPRPVCASRRTRPVPASSVRAPGRRIVQSRASSELTYASASPLARR